MAHDSSRESPQKLHVHKYIGTSKWGIWITDPRLPDGNKRLYCGAYDTKYLALRAQDRANLKFNPNTRYSGELNFKASDYDLDKELRDTLSRKSFRKLLMGESRSCYNKWDPSPCWKKFLDEEASKGNIPKGAQNSYLNKKPVKSLATALQELTDSSRTAATVSNGKVAPEATRVQQHRFPSRESSKAELTKRITRSAAQYHANSRSTPADTMQRVRVEAPRNLQPTAQLQAPKMRELNELASRQASKVLEKKCLPARQAPKVLQPTALPARQTPKVLEQISPPAQQAPKVLEQTSLPARQAPKVRQPIALPVQQTPKVQQLNELAVPTLHAPKVLQPTALVQQAPKVRQPTAFPVQQAPKVRRPTELPNQQAPKVRQPTALPVQNAPKVLRPTAPRVQQAPKVPQPIAIPAQQAPKDRQPSELPIRPKVRHVRELAIQQVPLVQHLNELAIRQMQLARENSSDEQHSGTNIAPHAPLDVLEWKRTGKRSAGTKRINPATQAAAPKPCNKKKKLLDLNREPEPDASSTESCEDVSDEVEDSATTLCLLKAGWRTA